MVANASPVVALVSCEAKQKGIIPLPKPHVEILRLSKAHFSDDLLDYALVIVDE